MQYYPKHLDPNAQWGAHSTPLTCFLFWWFETPQVAPWRACPRRLCQGPAAVCGHDVRSIQEERLFIRRMGACHCDGSMTA